MVLLMIALRRNHNQGRTTRLEGLLDKANQVALRRGIEAQVQLVTSVEHFIAVDIQDGESLLYLELARGCIAAVAATRRRKPRNHRVEDLHVPLILPQTRNQPPGDEREAIPRRTHCPHYS